MKKKRNNRAAQARRKFPVFCFINFVLTFWMERFTRTAELDALTLSSTFRSRNSCSMAEFRVECLTYAHSRARPVPSLTSPGYSMPPTVTIKRPSRLEPPTFLLGTCALTTRSPTLYRLSYGTGLLISLRSLFLSISIEYLNVSRP